MLFVVGDCLLMIYVVFMFFFVGMNVFVMRTFARTALFAYVTRIFVCFVVVFGLMIFIFIGFLYFNFNCFVMMENVVFIFCLCSVDFFSMYFNTTYAFSVGFCNIFFIISGVLYVFGIYIILLIVVFIVFVFMCVFLSM